MKETNMSSTMLTMVSRAMMALRSLKTMLSGSMIATV